VGHISLSDPMTWVVVLLAALLIAGLRYLVRARGAPPEPPTSDEEPKV
jgi:hypothetical protein